MEKIENCPICGKPRAKGYNKQLLKTCGSEECVSELRSRNARRVSKKSPWRKMYK